MTNLTSDTATRRQLALDLWKTGVSSASGSNAVTQVIKANKLTSPTGIVAIGKAAAAMTLGAMTIARQGTKALVVTKYGHAESALTANSAVEIIESAHPIPDQNSLRAGKRVLEFVQGLTSDDRLLLLISGGASSLVEVLTPGITLDDLRELNQDMISQDRTIEEINAARRELSMIKSGGLLSHFKGAHVDVVFISDVAKDDPNVIGSGIGHIAAKGSRAFTMNSYVAANNASARAAVAGEVTRRGEACVENSETLSGEISDLSKTLADALRVGAEGVYIWGGEPVVNLPENPGNGGRNQALALLLARELQGVDGITVVVGGTDGTDGPTNAAGGIIDGSTYKQSRGHDDAITRANAGDALADSDALLVTGPTGTNVMDLIVAVKASPASQ